MKPRILLVEGITEKSRKVLEEKYELVMNVGYDDNIVAIYTGLTPVNASIPVICPCTNTDHVKSPDITYLDQEFKVTQGRLVSSTAEYTLSLILQLAKANKMQLKDKRILIIGGRGRIGDKVWDYCSSLEIDVDIFEKEDKKTLLYELLPNMDIVTIHIPLNYGTENFLSFLEFEYMKKGVLIINTSRAEIVDEQALLFSQKGLNYIGGYADDFYDSHSELFKFNVDGEKLISTPHIAGNCVEAREITDLYVANKFIGR